MDGAGYPRGLNGDQMSVPARMMAIAHVFEALTAADRPYKGAKSLSESLGILSRMSEPGHIDRDLFRLFLEAGVHKTYAERFLLPEQIDEVELSAYLDLGPAARHPVDVWFCRSRDYGTSGRGRFAIPR